MSREEEIKRASVHHLNQYDYSYEEGEHLDFYIKGFTEGANWADEHPNFGSVWHEPSEEPEGDYCDILHQDENGCCWIESKADVMQLYDTWNEFIEIETIIRWAFVSDLLPKGGKL